MNYIKILIISYLCLFGFTSFSQDLNYSKGIIQELCSEKYEGRGYVDDGVNKAASYLEKQFSILKLKRFGSSYFQDYAFPVNTHPFPIRCALDNVEQKLGYDYIVACGSPRISGKFDLLHFNMKDSLDESLLYKKMAQGIGMQNALVLHNTTKRNAKIQDSLEKYQIHPKLIIYTEEKKLTHSISTEVDAFPSIEFMDSVIQNKEHLEIEANNEFIKNQRCKNIIGFVKGKNKDSFMVFSAHYDHLGKQGTQAMFPGASDNASGVSMILYLANYFSKHKPKYNTVFILFSGEEAGLIGSDYFTTYPTFDIQKIKMLVNVDIMGNAEDGITVVNGEVFKPQFDLLTQINAKENYLPAVKIRGKAANSDHYHFSEKGIPAIFIYSNGGQGYYHDVFDKADALKLTNYENVAKLLIDFAFKL